MANYRVLIASRDTDDPHRPAAFALTKMAVYFPDGCPAPGQAGLPKLWNYRPHAVTVCPACITAWRADDFVSDPLRVPTAPHRPFGSPGPPQTPTTPGPTTPPTRTSEAAHHQNTG
ncbi:hypothetical protein E0F15_01460 [Frankia sp. B2]|uniref:hypothetical protein n=1 Tax=unclassified Frankia TaxID=2632575 RepID=UPI0004613CF5|nr:MULTISPECIES: hypothetical protein [unclassified Frankia]KDA41074.1 hypothetical protein BMG523Draft_04120 [Frankia sp. BMG5.23]ORT46884.1 hypothetical protein KBI5_22780 [Frankia sp. KB5]TFE35542.1 hypothetical protein E0F15_01460 [Frankia sp. B2]